MSTEQSQAKFNEIQFKQAALNEFLEDFERNFWPIYKRHGIDKGSAIEHYTTTFYFGRFDFLLNQAVFNTRSQTGLTTISQEADNAQQEDSRDHDSST